MSLVCTILSVESDGDRDVLPARLVSLLNDVVESWKYNMSLTEEGDNPDSLSRAEQVMTNCVMASASNHTSYSLPSAMTQADANFDLTHDSVTNVTNSVSNVSF